MKLDIADTTFATAIKVRDKWTCQRCGAKYNTIFRKKQGLHCSHYFGRQAEGTRYDPCNATSLCYKCHNHWDTMDKEGYREFKIKQLGQERFDSLRLQSNTYHKKDRAMEYIKAKEYLKLMEQNEN